MTNEEIRVEISQVIPRNANGAFLRELIFGVAEIDWPKVEPILLKHFPELKLAYRREQERKQWRRVQGQKIIEQDIF
jgi:hypothetical protein